ncbi:polysaccharide biosynthesis protein [Acholeplasma manati]|uniref:Polysaccharide biosynthesis protein n=1 Tax=Paracholeplasma manati TaxID=591373 RepID=A0ABT2Y417_9MOLU|nr:nucleoside-diphosphate sugar epimerase/dehydratase [Paracholeplasma manati]MCV2231479.1 polysaccharide biosynthesis protein [Paracholeplasma manati]
MPIKLNKQQILHDLGMMVVDIILIFFAYFATIMMYMAVDVEYEIDIMMLAIALPSIAIFKIVVMYALGIYRMLSRHVGFEDVMRISIAAVITNVVIVLYIAMTNHLFMFKSAYIFITPIEIILLTVPRVLNRIRLFIKTNIFVNPNEGRRTLIIGAGSAGELVLREIYRNKDLTNHPVAFLDDNPNKIGNRLNGILIVGPVEHISKFIDDFNVEEIILAIADYPIEKLNWLVKEVSKYKLKIKKLLSYSDVDRGNPKIVNVKVEDLLNRQEIHLDNKGISSFIKDETVLVTGGGGSIGSELCRQIAELRPKTLVIFDIYENNAYEIQQELLRKFSKEGRSSELNLVVRIGSVYNKQRLETIFQEFKPTIVFHAAAYKHVPLMEDSAVEAVRTNVIGTYNTAVLSNQYGVKKFVLVSSDKAVRSTNVMGATKRFAELIIQNQQKENKTKFSAVRFGNVLGSNGSVIPLFKKQIEDGGPVTVTHPEINRFFMTIPEAVSLILQSAVYAEGGEVFILDMGQPVKIKDLAEKMISLAGYEPYKDIQIEFTGLRPGEKLFEELLVDHNYADHKVTDNDKIYIEKQKEVCDEELSLVDILLTFEDKSNEEIKRLVSSVVKTYKVNGVDH